MKVLDKIYLNRKHPEPYWFEDKQLDSDVEYIRKDTLLEWIEEYRNILSESLKNKQSPVTAGKMYVLIKLLDKLNSM